MGLALLIVLILLLCGGLNQNWGAANGGIGLLLLILLILILVGHVPVWY